MNKLSRFFVVAIAISSFLVAFSQRGNERRFFERFFTYPMLKPGETIDDMVITTDIEDAFPLWAICSSKKVNDHSIRADCGELSHANLAIGHTFGVMGLIHAMNLIPQPINWEELVWKMSVDGHPIDLEAFGVYDFVQIFHPSHSGREVVRVSRVWDIVLVNPTPGMHRLQGQAQTPGGAETYTWVVNFTVATP